MALILDNTIIDSAISKLIETPQGFIINAQYYDKDTFSPVPFNQIPINNAIPNLLFTNKKTSKQATINGLSVYNGDCIINDDYINDRFYIFGSTKIYVFDKKASYGVNLVTSASFNYYFDKYLGQTENYLYFFCIDVRYSRLYSYNKTNNAVANLAYYDGGVQIPGSSAFTHRGVSSFKICETEEYIYYANKYVSYFMSIARILKNTNTVQLVKNSIGVLLSSSSYGVWRCAKSSDIFINDNIASFYILNLSNPEKPFRLLKLDLAENNISNMIDIIDIEFEWGINKTRIALLSQKQDSVYESFIIKKDNKTFLNLIMYQTDSGSRQSQQGLYTFEIIDFYNLKFTSYSDISSSSICGFLITENANNLIIITTDSIVFLSFNINTGSYQITQTIPKNYLSVGLDLSERVWVMNTDYTIELLTLGEVTNFTITPSQEFYKYQGENIETFVTIEAKNYNDEFINSTLELKIIGNAEFSNNNKIITINTTDKPLNVPITITGADRVSIYTKFIGSIWGD